MSKKATGNVTKTLLNLQTKVSELVKKAKDLSTPEIRIELEKNLSSVKDSDLIAENATAIEIASVRVINKFHADFWYIYHEIIHLLNELKKKSYDTYLDGFKYTFAETIKIVYDERFIDRYSESEFWGDEVRDDEDAAFNCTVILCHYLGKKIFKSLTDMLIIDRVKDFDAAFNLPESFNDVKNYIKKGLYEMELFKDGKIKQLKYYNIPRAIEKFNSVRFNYENNPKKSKDLLNKYYNAVSTLSDQIDHFESANEKAHDDKIFVSMFNDLYSFS